VRKVLLVAPTVDGNDVGEAWVGYQWARHLSERTDLTLLTYRKRDRPPVTPQVPGARVIEWVEPPLLGRNERFNSLLKPGYLPFYLRVRRWIRQAQQRGEHFAVAHQPVPVGIRYPCMLAGLGIPYVVGPLGGGLETPSGFEEQDTAPWYVALRRTDAWRLAHDPVLRRGLTEASCVLGIAPYVAEALRTVPIRRFELMPETGLETLPEDPERVVPREGRVRLLFVGRLVRTKGARDAICALAHLRDLDVELEIVGDGFDRDACEETARTLDVVDRVTFRGALSRGQVEERYREADIFVFPSYREPGGNVPFEAMGHGLPLVVADRGGPANVVDSECGIRVPVTTPDQFARDLAEALRSLVVSPETRAAMGVAARKRVESIGLWSSKIDSMLRLYDEIQADARSRSR